MHAVGKLGRVQASRDAVVAPRRNVFGPLDDTVDREVDVVDVPGRHRRLPGDAPRDCLVVAGRGGVDAEGVPGARGEGKEEQSADEKEMKREALRAAADK